jgi:branched-chain amino acid transport system ATP-binding protein
VTVRYGKSLAVDKVSLDIEEGAIVILVGANGAGKTTILNVISGIVAPDAGEVLFDGTRIDGMPAFRIARGGVVHVPEGRRLFATLSVEDNLKLGAGKEAKDVKASMERIFEEFPILRSKKADKAGSLSGGQQQILAIARALMAKPRLLMLDEPCLGLAPVIIENLYSIVRNVNERGVSVLLAEQNVSLAVRLGTYGYALAVGNVVLEGDMDKLRSGGALSAAYLGEG